MFFAEHGLIKIKHQRTVSCNADFMPTMRPALRGNALQNFLTARQRISDTFSAGNADVHPIRVRRIMNDAENIFVFIFCLI